jgi:hypothetical protein
MRIHLLHGIHTEGANQAPELLIPYLKSAGFDVRYADYGFILAVESRIVNPIVVGSMLPYIEPGDIVIGHSNGCAIAYDLMHAGAPFGGAVFINAALEQDIIRPVPCKWIDVYYNGGDTITEAARVAEQLHIVDANWGEMGHAGYVGKDPAITNINCAATPMLPSVSGHSDIFTKLALWGPAIVARITSHYQAMAA